MRLSPSPAATLSTLMYKCVLRSTWHMRMGLVHAICLAVTVSHPTPTHHHCGPKSASRLARVYR